MPALVCRHKFCRRCIAEVPPSVSSPVDKKLWHVAQLSFETVTFQNVNQPKYLTLQQVGFNATHKSFFWKVQNTRQLPRLTGLAMVSNVNFTFAGMLLDTYSSFTIIHPIKQSLMSSILLYAPVMFSWLFIRSDQRSARLSCSHDFSVFLCEVKIL